MFKQVFKKIGKVKKLNSSETAQTQLYNKKQFNIK